MREIEKTIELKLVDFMKLSLEFPNDMEFGKSCRYLFPDIRVNNLLPNDMVLGKFVRNYLYQLGN